MREILELAWASRGRRRAALAISNPGRQIRPGSASILIVEDDPIMAMALEDELTALGHDVVDRTDSGEDAVALAERYKPDIVFFDVRLRTSTDGIAAAREIRSRMTTRIVFVTAHVDPNTRAAMDAVGYHALLPKPYTSAQLADAIRRALQN